MEQFKLMSDVDTRKLMTMVNDWMRRNRKNNPRILACYCDMNRKSTEHFVAIVYDEPDEEPCQMPYHGR